MEPHDRAHRAAQHALELMSQPATLESEDWLLIATLLVEADEALEAARSANPGVRIPTFNAAVTDLRDITDNFANAEFLSATKPIRRQHPYLFRSKVYQYK